MKMSAKHFLKKTPNLICLCKVYLKKHIKRQIKTPFFKSRHLQQHGSDLHSWVFTCSTCPLSFCSSCNKRIKPYIQLLNHISLPNQWVCVNTLCVYMEHCDISNFTAKYILMWIYLNLYIILTEVCNMRTSEHVKTDLGGNILSCSEYTKTLFESSSNTSITWCLHFPLSGPSTWRERDY